MSVAAVYAYLQSFAWNSATLNAGSGGPIRFELMKTGDALEEWTADQVWPGFLAVVQQRLRIRVTLRDMALAKTIAALGTKANGTAVLLPKIGGATLTINLANLVLIGVDPAEQRTDQAGGVTLSFGHESADGTTDPVS